MATDEYGRQVSDDGRWVWSGTAWLPRPPAYPPPPPTARRGFPGVAVAVGAVLLLGILAAVAVGASDRGADAVDAPPPPAASLPADTDGPSGSNGAGPSVDFATVDVCTLLTADDVEPLVPGAESTVEDNGLTRTCEYALGEDFVLLSVFTTQLTAAEFADMHRAARPVADLGDAAYLREAPRGSAVSVLVGDRWLSVTVGMESSPVRGTLALGVAQRVVERVR